MKKVIAIKRKKVGIYVAHDDDAILGTGGTIVQLVKSNSDVYIVIFTDGRNSHKAVLGIENNPSTQEVCSRRKEEIIKAMAILGVPGEKLHFFELTDGDGEAWQNSKKIIEKTSRITKKEKPDLIYFHSPDAHPDHRAANKIIRKTLASLMFKPESYQFIIWTKDLARDRPEVDASRVPKIPQNAHRIDIREERNTKAKALLEMKSQIKKQPYPDWQIQKKPILDEKFIDHFLEKEEIFIKY